MKYSLIVEAYEKIGATTKRLAMTDYLVELIKETPKDLIGKVAYLTQGKLYPDFMGVEIGMAEKMAITSIAKASGAKKETVERKWKEIGDLGVTAEKFMSERWSKQTNLFRSEEELTVEEAYDTFDKISKVSGKGAVETKVNLLTKLLVKAKPLEAKYLVRTITGRLRVGIGDMTFLDALAIAYCGEKKAREKIERAYNLSSDLGLVSETLAKKGLKGIEDFEIVVGRPIKPMLSERLKTPKEILDKMGGEGAAEYKYDGLRMQAHISPEKTQLFSRRLENITDQFPDIVEALGKSIRVKCAIVEGECIPVDPNTGEILPFQVVSQRRGRKYEIKEKIEEIPVVLVLFDILSLEGKTLVNLSYPERRKILEKTVKETDRIQLTRPKILDKPEEVDKFMDEAIAAGCEGLVIKSIKPSSVYQAGNRGFLWIKYKREYKSEMADTVDLVIVGALAGRGKRAGTYGALLMAAYDEDSDSFKTVCKLGTGFDDKTLASLPKTLKEYRLDHVHPRVSSKMVMDFWFVPVKVLEVRGAELTLSPAHTCALDVIKKGDGLAVRFPRFTGRWRDDKAPEDATTVKEIISMYKAQLKHVKS